MGFDRLSKACSKTYWKVRGIEFKLAPDLCNGCRAMNLASSFWKGKKRKLRDSDHPSFKSLKSLQDAATTCPLCALLLAQSLREVKWRRAEPLEESSWRQGMSVSAGNYSDVYELFCHIRHTFSFHFVVSAQEGSRPPPWFIRLQKTYYDPPQYQLLRLVDRTPTSELSIKMIQTWLAKCSSHPECQQELSIRRKRSVPDRLIHVGSIEDPTLRLVVTDPLTAEDDCLQYIALSYCWGTGNSYLATKSSHTSMMTSIDEQMLPQTLRDAIWVTRQLKVRHIWIDSLCIWQDDRDDWARQSAKMGQYYGDAYFTIAASTSSDAQSGFLKTRDAPSVVQYGSILHGRNGTLKETAVFVSLSSMHLFSRDIPLDHTVLANEPLTARGWALQERVLSTRILHFSTDQLIWDCKHTIEFENGLRRKPQPFRWQPAEGKSDVAYSGQNADAWRRIIEQYSKCTLTDSRDRLPAIAGIASTFQSDNPGVGAYLAGHWENHLPVSLIWSLHGRKEGIGSPSWSWSSKNGAITYWLMSEAHVIGRLVGFDIHTDKSNPFGEVQYGRLDIEAPVIRVENLHRPGHRFNFRLVLDDGAKVFTDELLDFDTDDIPQELYLLILMIGLNDSMLSGLLITPTGSTVNQYQRIGVFGFLKDLNKSQLPPARTISLV